MNARVWAIIPAYGRPALLRRALASLSDQVPQLARVIVANNSSDAETARIASAIPVPVTVLDFKCNLGTAGGIAAGLDALRQHPEPTHAWILDDDAEATPGALREMLVVAEASRAGAVAPLLTDASGCVTWFPGPLPQPAWDVVRRRPTPAEFLARAGEAPLRWNWAIWASLLISREAIEVIGYPRMDLWSQFSDIDYTLRLSERFPCLLAPRAVCRHLPPTAVPSDDKVYWGLQNGDYVCLRTRNGTRMLRHLPGHHWRFLRHHRWRPQAWLDSAAAVWRAAVLGRTPGNSVLREEFARAAAAFPAWTFAGEPVGVRAGSSAPQPSHRDGDST